MKINDKINFFIHFFIYCNFSIESIAMGNAGLR